VKAKVQFRGVPQTDAGGIAGKTVRTGSCSLRW